MLLKISFYRSCYHYITPAICDLFSINMDPEIKSSFKIFVETVIHAIYICTNNSLNYGKVLEIRTEKCALQFWDSIYPL